MTRLLPGVAAGCAAILLSSSVAGLAETAVTFTDVTARAGITFVHNNGAFGKKYLPETLGSGCLFLDIDNDGAEDILLVNSTNWPGHAGPKSRLALYRNTGDGTFVDVTAGSGLDVELYGLGGAAADYDNDGRVDVYITALGGNRLFHNAGNGKFVDVTKQSGTAAGGLSTSALWFDYNNDGRVDLFVARYVDWSIEKDLVCTLDGKSKSYCTPESYHGSSSVLYRNRGDGTFDDVTTAAGLEDATSKALGVAMLDFDGDGWMDLFVANDTQPNKLYRNNGARASQASGSRSFTDVAMVAGVAYNEAGVARAGMGVDAADYDGSGRPSLVIGNFSNEMMALYHNEGTGLFIDEAPRSAIGHASLLTLTFACFFFDYDLDGRPDIFAVNGHVADDINRVQPRVAYEQPPHLFRNVGPHQFEEVSRAAGAALQKPMVGRGGAYADIDNDGDLDLLLTANHGAAALLRNDGGNRNNALRIRLVGTKSNKDGIGARVEMTVNGTSRWQMVKTGSSYCSQSELPLTFGLGTAANASAVRIRWPSGRVDTLGQVAANQSITIQEEKGIVAEKPLARRSAR
ncbi:MAG: CRTAC1 family protein [Acidobacteria bacterium]|nr:CRTAC1 family protein [Acidobacteriota bacterium]